MFRPLLRCLPRLKSLLQLNPRTLALPVCLPFLLYRKHLCFFGFSASISPNHLQSRTTVSEYPANNPAEDRWATYQLKHAEGYVVGVFDGHVGWHVAEFAKKNIGLEIDNAIKRIREKDPNKSQEKVIVEAINQAFNQIENNFLRIAKGAYQIGFAQLGGEGSCALVLVVANNKLYAANAGDSQALVFEAKGENNLTFTKLNKKLNANSKKEKARLQSQFPTEKDIVQCVNNHPKACYVKGRLQPTRSFGDFRLKFAEFNNPEGIGREYGHLGQIKNFTGPYLTHVPDIRIIDLTENHKCAVIATDGLWDELSKPQVTDLVAKKLKEKKIDSISQTLLDTALEKAAKDARLSVSDLKKIPQGDRRRRLHDDITIITLNLQNQSK